MNMVPKQKLNKHDFKTGLPKEEFTYPRAGYDYDYDFGSMGDLRYTAEEMERSLATMGVALSTFGEQSRMVLPYGRERVKSRTEKFIDWWGVNSIMYKISLLLIFFLFILPTVGQLILFTIGMFIEPTKFIPTYIEILSTVRVVGVVLAGLLMSIHTLWILK